MSFGQTPFQIFTKGHPARMARKGRLMMDEDSELKVYRPTSRNERPLSIANPFNVMQLPI
jgi:hypothetical protein